MDYYGVATIEEAMELRECGIKLPILILGYTSPSQYLEVVENNITQTVYNIEMAEEMSKAGSICGQEAKVHIALDTGMTRIGFPADGDGISELTRFQIFQIWWLKVYLLILLCR